MEEVQAVTPLQEEASNRIKSIKAYQLNRWIYRRIKNYLRGRIFDTADNKGMAIVYQENGIEVDTLHTMSFAPYNTVICVDIEAAIANVQVSASRYVKLLSNDGHFILLCLVHTAAYNTLGKTLKFWHNKNKSLIRHALNVRFELVKTTYFCLMSTPDAEVVNDKNLNRLITRFYIRDSLALQQGYVFIIGIAQQKSSKR